MTMDDNVSPAGNEERGVTQHLYPAFVVRRIISSVPDMQRRSIRPTSEVLRAANMNGATSNRRDLHPQTFSWCQLPLKTPRTG
jgi:hypothetical protein